MLKRTKRRIYIAIPKNILLYIFMMIFWGIFIIVTFVIGNIYKAPDSYTWFDVIWELKAPMFTSIFLAILMVSYSQIAEYRKTIKEQYSLYLDTLYTFDDLLDFFLKEISDNYMPFYTMECVRDSLSYLKDYDFTNCFYDDVYFDEVLTDIQERLYEIQTKMKSGAIIGMHEQGLEINIRESRKLIRSVYKKHEGINYDVIERLTNYLVYIIANIRRPWRWDTTNNGKALEVLAKNSENDINNQFYYRMQLSEYRYEKNFE